MRYKEGQEVNTANTYVVPKDQQAVHSSDNMLVLTSIIGFFVGFILFYLGRKGKQMYLWVWGIGLVLSSIYLGMAMMFDFKLFSKF